MKTITFNSNSVSAYIFEDGHLTSSSVGNIETANFIIGDLNSTNATIHAGVTPPADWMGGRYTFDGTEWAAVEGWVDPSTFTDPE
tara:strand:- start:1225 stop:1479 length:255 start_codon:yes stop_codon:yes gene_type:complete